MIVAGNLLVPGPGMTVALAPGGVRLEGGRIAEVFSGPCPHAPDLGGEGAIICPGFVDAHLHLPQFDSIGVDGLPLLEWLERAVFPAEARWADADFAGAMTDRAARRLLAAGTTGIAAYATVHHEGARAAIEALAGRGVRAVVGQVLMDQGAPAELIRPAERLLAEAAALEGSGRVEVAVTPRFAVSCSDRLLRGAGELARRRGLAVQTHLSETREECALVARLHGGLGYTEVYRRAGLLTPRTILGHGIWLDDEERRAVAASGALVAHCPTANLFLQAGSMDLAAHRAAGVGVCLGSDVAGGPDVSMVRVARAMIETAKRLRLAGREGTPLPDAAACWWQITAGNAAALGWRDGGRIGVGAPADLLVVEPDVPWRESPDPLSTLLYAWDNRWIRATLLEGKVAYSAGV